MFKKILLPFLLISIFSIVGIGETKAANCVADTIPKGYPILNGNWNNVMDPKGCVVLDIPGQYLKIKAIFQFATNDLSSVDDIYYQTSFDGSIPDLDGPIEEGQLVETTLPNGSLIYVFTVDVYSNDFKDKCNNLTDPTSAIPFEYEISLVDEFGDPYPIEDNLELITITTTTGEEDPQYYIDASSLSYEGSKDLCCSWESSGGEGGTGLIQNDPNGHQHSKSNYSIEETNSSDDINSNLNLGSNLQNNPLTEQAAVFPNPFNNSLKVNFESFAEENTVIQLWDINGQLVFHQEVLSIKKEAQEILINTNNLNTGFYFCSIKNSRQSHQFKVLKL